MCGAGDHEKTSIPVWKEQLSWSERDSERVRFKAEKAGSFDAAQTFISHPHFLQRQCAIGARTTPPTCSHCPAFCPASFFLGRGPESHSLRPLQPTRHPD